MKAAPFDHHAPTSVAEATGLLRELGDEAKLLAGGQSLLPLLALRLARFGHLVDLGGIGSLTGIERRDGHLRIGAMTPQAAVGRSAEVARAVPLLRLVTPLIGHFQTRERGTIGGSVAHADPAAEYPAVALALDADLEVAGPDGSVRRVPADEFFVSTFTTALAEDELLVAVELPVWAPTSGFAVEELARRHGDFAVVGVVSALELVDGRLARAGICLFGVDGVPRRAPLAEQALVGATPDELSLVEVGRAAVEGLEPADDLHGSSSFRRQVAANLTTRALERAVAELGDG